MMHKDKQVADYGPPINQDFSLEMRVSISINERSTYFFKIQGRAISHGPPTTWFLAILLPFNSFYEQRKKNRQKANIKY